MPYQETNKRQTLTDQKAMFVFKNKLNELYSPHTQIEVWFYNSPCPYRELSEKMVRAYTLAQIRVSHI